MNAKSSANTMPLVREHKRERAGENILFSSHPLQGCQAGRQLSTRMEDLSIVRSDGFQQRNVEVCRLGGTVARLAVAYQAGFLALQRARSGGRQVVTVQHVHVGDGGQAVVAAKIGSKGGGGVTRNPVGEIAEWRMNYMHSVCRHVWNWRDWRLDAERIPSEPAGPARRLQCPTGVVECMAERAPALALLRD